MQQLFDRSLFSVGEVTYTWRDVILFAMLSGHFGFIKSLQGPIVSLIQTPAFLNRQPHLIYFIKYLI